MDEIKQLVSHNTNTLECIQNDQISILNKLKDLSILLKRFDNKIDKYRTVSITNKTNLDKFYTNPNIVDMCIKQLLILYKWDNFNLVVEPSAGDGNFYLKIKHPNKIGIDISPDHSDIIKQDFFTFNPTNIKKILTLGNPPFGRISSLAIKFFNHASKWSDVIAFIIPKTFRKISIQNRLNLNFHLVLDKSIPNKPCSFTPKMNVKCCFQIWQKKKELRELIKLPTVTKKSQKSQVIFFKNIYLKLML